ncbi:hypothetical protein ACH6CV_16850 [Bacillota bacterium Meth-B3]
METNERARLMIEAYGEAVTRAMAGRIINRSPTTIANMLADGRLDAACEGTRVDVYSLARYICTPKANDFEARTRKRYPSCTFRV